MADRYVTRREFYGFLWAMLAACVIGGVGGWLAFKLGIVK